MPACNNCGPNDPTISNASSSCHNSTDVPSGSDLATKQPLKEQTQSENQVLTIAQYLVDFASASEDADSQQKFIPQSLEVPPVEEIISAKGEEQICCDGFVKCLPGTFKPC